MFPYSSLLLLGVALALPFGSALATIGLTIPAVVLVSVVLGLPLVLGLGSGGISFVAASRAVME